MSAIALIALVLTAGAAEPGGAAPGAEGRSAFADGYEIKIAVMELTVSGGLDSELAASLTAALPEAIDRLGPFDAISSQEVVRMLTYAANRQALGCADEDCFADVGDALGADFVVSGNLTLVADTLVIQLQLMESRGGKVASRVSHEHVGGGDDLFNGMRAAAKSLMRPVLGEHAGSLRVDVSEEGATIIVDDNVVGVSPMDQAMAAAAGGHTIGVEKQGFVLFRQDVTVSEDRLTAIPARLQPSAEFVRVYREEASFMRIVAYATGAGSLGILGLSAALFVASADGARSLASDVERFNAKADRTTAEHDTLRGRGKGVAAMELGAIFTLGVGVAALTAGTALWILGDDPDRYGDPEDAAGIQAGVTILPGGIGLTGRF